MRSILSILLLFSCAITFAQTTISGTVVDGNEQPIPGANVIVSGTTTGTITDFDGAFTLTVSQSPPFTIQASSVGFESASLEVTSSSDTIKLVLTEGTS
ncbi:MAG: hypothetical protein CMC55_00805, partial [Flavobacteriaceae bacterium]|nr:hypothetical protein [Flavobacteriaceae bacterium]